MPDLVHVDSDLRDPHAYARTQALESLPAHAQSRYNSYAERKREAEMMSAHYRERGDELGQRLQRLLHNANAARQSGSGSLSHHEKQASAAQAEYDALAAKRSRVERERTAFDAILNALNSWLVAKGNWLDRGPMYDPSVSPSVAKPNKNESLAEAIQRAQGEVSAAKLRLAQVKSAPPPGAEIREMVVAELARIKNSYSFGHRFVTDGNGVERLELVAPDLASWLIGTQVNPREMITGYMIHLLPERMVELFTANISEDAPGIARADKPRLLAELECKIVEAELEECSLIEQAQAVGLDVLPRPSMSPLSLLGLVPMRPQQPMLEAAE